MATHEFFCHLTGAIHSADLYTPPALAGKLPESHFLYCPFCGNQRVLPWEGYRNVSNDPATEHWRQTHEWREVK
jgi:hypothetical protein